MIKQYALPTAKIIIALALVMAGGAKLAGVEMVHLSFATLGLPGWFGYFIGACEIAGAVGLFIKPLSALAALGLACVMLGAVYYHAVYTPIAEALPALIILLVCVLVFLQGKSAMLKFDKSE